MLRPMAAVDKRPYCMAEKGFRVSVIPAILANIHFENFMAREMLCVHTQAANS
jgi:hypothetical protein